MNEIWGENHDWCLLFLQDFDAVSPFNVVVFHMYADKVNSMVPCKSSASVVRQFQGSH